MPRFRTVDDVELHYEDWVAEAGEGEDSGVTLVLIHGWSGSGRAFAQNVAALRKACSRVIALDLRSHGRSQKVTHGAHVARLAADLRELLVELRLERVAMLGSSLGCAVIWSFVELFGCAQLAAAIFVDQAPLQNDSMDGSWRLGSRGIFSPASLGFVMGQLKSDPASFMRGNAEACLTRAPTADDYAFWGAIGLEADPDFLIALMADHTALDWRSTLPRVSCPALVVGPLATKIFPAEGVRVGADLMPFAQYISMPGASHWCYYEEADAFNSIVIKFLQTHRRP
mmetsp:Transcript_6491/g.17369  ORF Transcript_6491/g.17369 Transcript_6491/m.17369 type:complete len:285 (-) Transcript_6491:1743-2597(-)